MMKAFKASVVAILMLASPPQALADEGGPLVNGQITKVDPDTGKLTIKHDAIPNLDMDAMTMIFKAGEGVTVEDVKPGDKIRFHAEKINGQITVTQVEKVK
jgi:Cu/Ag efflux protein CusF